MRHITSKKKSWRILSPQGDFMCFTHDKKALWYLRNSLAAVVEQNKTIQLKFDPGGPGAINEFDKQEFAFCCVVCGKDHSLNRHHIVPQCFRSYMGEYFKNNANHDIVFLCLPCHLKYEDTAIELRKNLVSIYNAPMAGCYTKNLDHSGVGVRECIRLFTMYNRASEHSKNPTFPQVRQKVTDLIAQHPSLSVLIVFPGNVFPGKKHPNARQRRKFRLARSKFFRLSNEYFGYKTQGKIISEQVILAGEVAEFIRSWRHHFVSSMQPKFLPKGWRVDYTAKQRDHLTKGSL